MRPFPQIATGGKTLKARWTEYRSAMIEYAGIAVFVFGNRRNAAGATVSSDGMREEFDLCVKAGVCPIPVGATGFMAETFWKEVSADLAKYIPGVSANFKRQFKKLGDRTKRPAELLETVQRLIDHLQKR
jgi:hypothetical protein